MSIATDELPTSQLYTQYGPALLRYLTRLTRSPAEAEDLMQETFVKVLSHGGPPPSTRNVKAWLYAIARNSAYDWFRRIRRRPALARDSKALESALSADATAQYGERDEVRATLRHLPEAYSVPLLLHAVAGYSLEELATMLDMRLGTVKSRLHRARARFRAAYPNSHPGRPRQLERRDGRRRLPGPLDRVAEDP